MKQRNGFVSNSSSTSFCIFGVQVNEKWGDTEEIETAAWTSKIEVHHGCGDYCEDDMFIGVCPSEIKDNETFSEFRIRIAKMLSDHLKVEIKPKTLSYIHDGGYNG